MRTYINSQVRYAISLKPSLCHIQKLSDASLTDDFWNHCHKRKQKKRLRVPEACRILSFYGLFISYKKSSNSEWIFSYYNDRTQLTFFKYWNKIDCVEINKSKFIYMIRKIFMLDGCHNHKPSLVYGFIKSTVTKDIEYITVFLFLVTVTLNPKTQSD